MTKETNKEADSTNKEHLFSRPSADRIVYVYSYVYSYVCSYVFKIEQDV